MCEMKMSNKRPVGIFLMGVLMLNCGFAAESGNKKRIDRFSESKNFYDGKFHNHNDVKLASPSFWRATKAVMFEGADRVPTRPLPVNRLNSCRPVTYWSGAAAYFSLSS